MAQPETLLIHPDENTLAMQYCYAKEVASSAAFKPKPGTSETETCICGRADFLVRAAQRYRQLS